MNKLKRHVRDYFKAISQTFFSDNPFFGVGLMLLLLSFNSDFFICASVGSLSSYVYSMRSSTPKALKAWGLLPINGLFFGLAMASMFQQTLSFYMCLLLGAMFIPMLTKASFEILQHWKLSPLVFPYILLIWIISLAGRGAALDLHAESWPDTVRILPHMPALFSPPFLSVLSMGKSVGRLLFLPDAGFGLAVTLLVMVFSPRRGFFFLAGTAVATFVTFFITVGSTSWESGYFGYSAGLVGLGLASFPERFNWRTILLFCTLSSFLTMAIDQLLAILTLPTLSLPYVFTLWTAILSRTPRFNVNWEPSKSKVVAVPMLRALHPAEVQESEKAA